MTKVDLIKAVFEGLTNLVKVLNIRSKCCCESSCSQEHAEYEGPEYDPVKKRWLGTRGLDGELD